MSFVFPDKQFFRTEEVALLLGVHISSVRRWTKIGLLSFHLTPGGHRRISRDVLLIRMGATQNV